MLVQVPCTLPTNNGAKVLGNPMHFAEAIEEHDLREHFTHRGNIIERLVVQRLLYSPKRRTTALNVGKTVANSVKVTQS